MMGRKRKSMAKPNNSRGLRGLRNSIAYMASHVTKKELLKWTAVVLFAAGYVKACDKLYESPYEQLEKGTHPSQIQSPKQPDQPAPSGHQNRFHP